MRIAYVSNVRIPTERAHGHQIAQVADAMTQMGHSVTLFAPCRKNTVKDDYWTYYGADRRVQLTYVGSYDFISSPFFPGPLGLFAMNTMLRKKLRPLLTGNFDLLYTRTPALLTALLATGIPTVVELHTLPRWGRQGFVTACNKCVRVVCLTTPMRDELVQWGVEAGKVLVEGDAVRLEQFSSGLSSSQAHAAFEVHEDTFAIGYAGQLQSMGLSKGVQELLDSLKVLVGRGVSFSALIAGGPDSARKRFQSQLSPVAKEHIRFMGHLEHGRIPLFLQACDVLVYPAPKSDHPFYMRDTSPMKLFEYMASQKPIVAADLPTVREILSEDAAVFCEPGNPESLADALSWVMWHPEEAKTKAKQAYELVQERTWEQRMRRILASATMNA